MTATPGEIARFADAVAGWLGLRLERGRAGELLQERAAAVRQPVPDYLQYLDAAPPSELGALASELTVGETYFLRHVEQFRAFTEVAVPDRLGHGRLRVLSAGCSSGEEPYTLAMLLRAGHPDAAVTVHAIDLNPASVARAQAGRYSRWSLRVVPPAFEHRWFRPEGKDVVVAPEIRAAVTFRQGNLLEYAALTQPPYWDIVFCRNVMMYFTDDCAEAVLARLALAVVPGGYLFLGHAETLRGPSEAFALRHSHGTFYYQRMPAATRPSSERAPDGVVERPGSDDPDAPSTPATTAARRALDHVRELITHERFADALTRLDELRARATTDRDVATLRALVLTHAGRFAEARVACAELLALDATSPGANYLLALCYDSAGDPDAAALLAQLAAELDPSFAMPRVHLGLLARRAGDREIACLELTRAIALLEREAPARLALYGGGFSRQALLGMCRAELAAIGTLR